MSNFVFMYWGRRGLSRFTLDLAEAADRREALSWRLSLSRDNEDYDRFLWIGDRLAPVRTFDRSIGAVTNAGRIPDLRRRMQADIRHHRIDAVINLMPHVWSPFVIDAIRSAGARYVTILHDAQRHPGDRSGLAHRLLLLDARRADHVVTLSQAVTDMAIERLGLAGSKITTLFHPHLTFKAPSPLATPRSGEPWRFLALGRIMAYKGLHLVVEAIERLRSKGIPVSLSVMGAGELGDLAPRLSAIGATVANRWLTEEEIDRALRGHHAVVLGHVEASQSGVAAAALGAGVPVVSFATGGLPEQIVDRHTGLLAPEQTVESLVEAIQQIMRPNVHRDLVKAIAACADRRSMGAFLDLLLAASAPLCRRPLT